MKLALHLLFGFLLIVAESVNGQTETIKAITVRTDSTTSTKNPALKRDTLRTSGKIDSIQKHDPRKATIRSALIPGWGQAYNKEVWKIPFVYAALGVTAGFYIYNQTWYKRTKRAFEIRIVKDTASFPKIDPKLKDISAESLRFYRNEFRKNKDYSILYFLGAWGLNVIDATVFAHLKDFDVSDDLSFKIKPGYSPNANTTGLSFVLAVKNSSSNAGKTSR
jgi:hypothetical protein